MKPSNGFTPGLRSASNQVEHSLSRNKKELRILFVVREYPGPWLNSPISAYVVSNLAHVLSCTLTKILLATAYTQKPLAS